MARVISVVGVMLCGLALVAAMVVGPAPRSVSADGGVHVQSAGAVTDNCAGCHRAHTGQAPQLLVDVQPALCYTCHGTAGTGAATAVQSGTLYTDRDRTSVVGGQGLRAGGFQTARINTADPSLPPVGVENTDLQDPGVGIGVLANPAITTSWHTIDGSAGVMWGNGALNSGPGLANAQLRCGSCHDPHGTGTYRLLRPQPTGSGAATAVVVVDETPGATRSYGTANYLRPRQGLTGANAAANLSTWCAQCHTRYLALNANNSGDAIFTYRHAIEDATNGVPLCTHCHVAHGTNALMGVNAVEVEWPDGTAGVSGTTDTNRSSLLRMDSRGICQKCHNK